MFPPVPADTAVALGAFLSVGGRISAWGVFGVTWTANVATATVVYFAARVAGRPFFKGPVGNKLLRPTALARLERWYVLHGTWAIFASRFVPGVRAVVPPFAGVAGLGAVRTLAPMALASALWYGGITFVAATAVRNVDQIVTFVRTLNRGALVGGVLTFLAVLGVVLVRRRARHHRGRGDT